MATQKKNVTAIALKIMHSLVFTVFTFLLTYFSKHIPTIQALFAISIGGALLAFLALKGLGIKIPLRLSKKSLGFYVLRTAISLSSMVTWIYTVKSIGTNESMAFAYITPFWLLISAVLFLGDKLTLRIMGAIIISSLGVVLIIQPKIADITFLVFSWLPSQRLCGQPTTPSAKNRRLQNTFSYKLFTLLCFTP
jgi:drug/metabolite transporter (DMT)-like permease